MHDVPRFCRAAVPGWIALGLLLAGIGCASAPAPTVSSPAVEPLSDAALAARLDPILLAPGARVGVRVIELPSRRELYARDADRAMMPASNMKLVTTATALDTFGPDHRFETRLGLLGNDLYLIGSGDPGLGDDSVLPGPKRRPTDDFDEFVAALKARGLTHVSGNLYYDDGALDAQRTHPSWSKGYREFWYAAPIGGLNFNDNCIDVTVSPTGPGQPARYEVMPPTARVHIDNRCVTGSGEPQIRRAAGPNDYVLTGTCAKRTELASKPIDDPGYFTADALKTYLASKGITIDGTIQPAPADAKPKVIATHSTRLADILRRLNKSSQNFMAEALDKLSGERLRQSQPNDAHGTSWEAGAQAARLFLTSHGIDATALVMADGSGLSRDNRVTARMLTDLLAGMDAHPSAAVFRDSLPVGGVDGTLRQRFTDVKGRVLAKTGSIGGVRSLSGYTTLADGRRVAFSILSNDIKGDEDAWLKQMDAAVRAMIQ